MELFTAEVLRSEPEPVEITTATIDQALRAGTYERYNETDARGFVQVRARRVCGVAGDPVFQWNRKAARWECVTRHGIVERRGGVVIVAEVAK